MAEENEIEDTSPEFELGDGVYIGGGRLDGTRGRIYYMDDDRIRILPVGVSDRLVEIKIVDGDLDPELEISQFFQTSKRAESAFVSQIDAHVDQIAETFGINGEPGITYTITEVNESDDTITLKDETGAEKKIEFNFTGIPLEEGFALLRPLQKPLAENNGEGEKPEMEEGVPDADMFENIDVVEAVEEAPAGLVERPLIQRTYPDIVQRNEMFQNLLEMLDVASQKNLKRQRDIRQLVEQMLLLRNEVVRYGPNGEPTGSIIPTSFQIVAELLEQTDIPLVRPVLDASRSVYFDRQKDGDNPETLPEVSIDVMYMRDIIDRSNEFVDRELGGAAEQVITAEGDAALPKWYSGWVNFYKMYMRSWLSEGGGGESVSFRGDKEFLRAPVPNGKDAVVDGIPKFGVYPLATASVVGKVRLSLLKGLGPRSIRLKGDEAPRRIESGDEGYIVSQLLFPLSAQRDLGSSRSGQLKKDIAFSHFPPKTILELLSAGVPEEATAGGIISIGEGGNTSGSIPIDEWIKSQPLHIRGLGDALVEIKNMGLTQKELTTDQQDVLIEKINSFRALLKQYIASEREISEKAIAELRLENLPFLQGEALEDLMTSLQSEPLILERIDEIQKRIPAYKDNDLAIIAGVGTRMSDLLLTVLAGVPAPLARERNRRVRDQFLEALRQALLKAEKKANAGEIPTPIQCPHTESIDGIRKVKNDDERMQLMARLLARFRGPTKDNWIQCSASAQGNPHNLICYHEFLQLQEYLHPREKDTLHKELLLKFSGGQFHGRFMCKNCGQAISNLEFDQSMEFDDNGRPMANRAALVDTDAVAEEEINLLLGGGSETGEEFKFPDGMPTVIYEAARILFDKLGIYADMDSYRNIVERVESDILKQPSREDYSRHVKARKGEGKPLDYDILINRILVSALGTHALIEIQTHVPDYVLRSKIPGCVAGFSGFPMGKDEDKTGINYISCAIASIKVNKSPWSLTGFLAQADDKKRQDMIAGAISKLASDAMKTAVVQQAISVKRAYYEKMYGSATSGDRIQERVSAGFRPVPYYITAEEATKAIVVPDAADTDEIVRAWIQSAHRLARENGVFVRGSPYVETTCCFTPISEPRSFWSEKEGTMPKLPVKTPPRGQACSQSMLPFTPRKAARLSVDPPEDLFYRVFLRICYDGPRKGLPHEPGYTNTCPHCGFVFPDDPYMETPNPPLNKDLYKEWQTEMESIITKGKSALEAQKVIVDRSTFENILDATHVRYKVAMPERRQPVSGIGILVNLGRLEPEPFSGFRRVLNEALQLVSKLPPNTTSDIAIAEAYAPLSNISAEVAGEIQRRLGAESMRTLQALLKQSASQVVESVRTYFLVPFQRLLLGFKPDSLKVQKSYGLDRETQDEVNGSVESHLAYLNVLRKTVKGYTELKLKQAQSQLTAALRLIQKEIRPKMIPGGADGSRYIVNALIVGILGEFINPNVVPGGMGGTGGAVEATARAPINILEVCFSRLQLEGLNFTEDEIRDLIARRTDAEKILFVTRQDKMTPEEKKSDLMMKRLGLGSWAIGGAKAVRTMDPDVLDREREQRIQMGLGNFALDADAAAHAAAILNDEEYGGGGAGAEGGYDVEQTGADDW
jgi:hypothetical protein